MIFLSHKGKLTSRSSLIRRSDCQSARCKGFENRENDIDQLWRAEVDAEQRRR
jgi:hypothetical protein